MLQSQLSSNKCGNSSVVERDLAMVDVASSTLVSRSIIIFFLCISQLFSLTLTDIIGTKIKERIQNIEIKNIELFQPNLPKDFSEFRLKDVEITSLNDNFGNVKAIYSTPKNERNLFIKFKLNAKVGVYIAKNDISRDKLLSINDYEFTQIDFAKYEKDAISNVERPLVARSNVKKGEILKNRQFRAQSDVKKGDQILVVVNDGILSAETLAIATQDGNIGQTIQLKSGSQIIRATITSKNKAIMR